MPHQPKKYKTSRTKAVERARRSRQRMREKNEFDNLQYLRSQLDEKGNPIDLLNTSEEILNNEQKFVSRLVKRLSTIDTRSIAVYLNENYNEDKVSELINDYYSTKENKSWSDLLFTVTYKCFGILNLNHLLTDKLFEYLNDVFHNVTETEGEELTDDVFNDILKKCADGLDIENKIDLSELINTCLLVYAQNSQTCSINEKEFSGGADNTIRREAMQGILGFILIIIIIIAAAAKMGVTWGMLGRGFLEGLVESLL